MLLIFISLHLLLDRVLFKQKRSAHLEAIKRITELGGFDKQYKMINVLLEKLFNVNIDI